MPPLSAFVRGNNVFSRRKKEQGIQTAATRASSRGLKTLEDFTKFARTDPRSRRLFPENFGAIETPTISFRGGVLTKPEFERATFLEQQELIDEFKLQEETARTATEEQREQVIGGFERLGETTEEKLAGLGTQAREDIRETFRRAEARGQSALVRSGLSSTTVAPAVSIRTAAEESAAAGRLSEQLRRENIGLTTGIEKERLGAIERQEISGPSQSLFIQLQQQLGNI